MNMILGDVEETISVVEVDERSKQSTKVCLSGFNKVYYMLIFTEFILSCLPTQLVRRNVDMLFVRILDICIPVMSRGILNAIQVRGDGV